MNVTLVAIMISASEA